LAITTLGVTGVLIGKPFSVTYAQEASFQYWFGTVRLIHFIAGYVFLFNMIVRTYWGFVGNRFARWDTFIPTTKAAFREIIEVLKIDILQVRGKGRIHIGHNHLAGLIYFFTTFIFFFQALTGFALYGPMSHSILGKMAAWVVPLMGGEMAVRQWHHAMLWFYVLFTLVHVYLVFYHDYVEGRGTTSSMVGGWKFERDDLLDR
jgi:Ni/Fe-hydrogenase 1 B-type cytochrome subunit